jgi:hypothetical protein
MAVKDNLCKIHQPEAVKTREEQREKTDKKNFKKKMNLRMYKFRHGLK